MKKRSEFEGASKEMTPTAKPSLPAVSKEEPTKKEDRIIKINHDPVNEQVIIAAVLVDPIALARHADRIESDTFLVPMHRPIWKAIQEMYHRRLTFDPATLMQLGAGSFDIAYVQSLVEARPDSPSNLEFHIQTLLWDKARHTASTGPIPALLEAILDPTAPPEKTKALARLVPDSLDGYNDRGFIHDGDELVREMMDDMAERRKGRAHYLFGIDGLDYYDPIPDEEPKKRLIPGSKPGSTCVVVGTSGSGKSTLVANMVNGLEEQGRRGLVCAWEMGGKVTLELCCAIKEGISLETLRLGTFTDDEKDRMRARGERIIKLVKFMKNPFNRKRGDRGSNDKNMDILQGTIADSGAEFVCIDLWRRMLRKFDPDEEELALYRQQAMAEEMNFFQILVQQIRLKDVEARIDKRPTREGIKGSGSWIEVADTLLATYRPALHKSVEDTTMEVFILKQRFGKWPLAIEFGFDGEFGRLTGGKSIKYDAGDGESSGNEVDGAFSKPRTGSKWSKGRPRGKA